MKILWGDDFTRFDACGAKTIEEGQLGSDPPIRLAGMRNAFVSFQLVVGPLSRKTEVRVDVSDLAGSKNRTISAKQIDVFVEWYVSKNGVNYPEVCVPQSIVGGSTAAFRRFNGVAGSDFAGFWVDIFVPYDAKSGIYSGKIIVRSGKEKSDVPLYLDVADVALGPDSCLDVSMNNYADSISEGWEDLKNDPDRFYKSRYRRIERGVFKAAHEHRAFLHYLPYGHSGYIFKSFAPPLKGEGAYKRIADWKDWDSHFGPYFDGSAFKGTRRGPVPVKRFYLPLNLMWPADFIKFGQPGYEAEWRAVGSQMVEHFKSRGWTKTSFDMFLNHKQRFRFFPWDTEEARFIADNDLQRYMGKLWKGTFDHETTKPVRFDYTFGTTWLFSSDIRSDLVDFVDVFIGGANDLMESQSELPRLHKLGRQIWPCLTSGNLPDSIRAAAYPPLMVWMLDGDGYMPRWLSMGAWGEEAWRNPAEDGGATFLYCGAPFGSEETFASVRLKAQRNSIQMVDALQIAAERIGKPAVKRAVNRVLGIPASGWLPTKKPDPNDTDRFTEEPPLAGWQNFTAEQNRQLRNLAVSLALGDTK